MSNHDEDVAAAIAEIKALTPNARGHIQHVFRNWLQSVSGLIELKELDRAKDVIHDVSNKLKRMGL